MDQNAIYKTSMTWGLVLGIAMVLFSLVPYIFGIITPSKWVSVLSFAVTVAGIVIGQIKHRDGDLDGYIGYGRALATGILVMFFATVVYGVYFVCLIKIIDPQYMEKVITAQAESLYALGYTEDMVEMAISATASFSPVFMFVTTVLGASLQGVLISLVSSAFVKRVQPMFPGADGEAL